MPCRSRFSFSVSANRRCASGFGYSLPRTRSNSGMPSCSSACCSTLVTAGCEMCSTWAAPLMVPTCMMAWKTSMWRRRMARQSFYWTRRPAYTAGPARVVLRERQEGPGGRRLAGLGGSGSSGCGGHRRLRLVLRRRRHTRLFRLDRPEFRHQHRQRSARIGQRFQQRSRLDVRRRRRCWPGGISSGRRTARCGSARPRRPIAPGRNPRPPASSGTRPRPAAGAGRSATVATRAASGHTTRPASASWRHGNIGPGSCLRSGAMSLWPSTFSGAMRWRVTMSRTSGMMASICACGNGA
jgi:hypothetical protein